MTLLTSPEARTAKTRTYRFYVELASTNCDYEGVPEWTRTIDVVVSEPTLEAITQLIAACEWLQGYELVSFWQPEDSAPF